MSGCDRGTATTGHAVYRINATGVLGVWACEEHRRNTDAPRDPELDRITKAIERAARRDC